MFSLFLPKTKVRDFQAWDSLAAVEFVGFSSGRLAPLASARSVFARLEMYEELVQLMLPLQMLLGR